MAATGEQFTEGDYLLGVEGLALLRASWEHDFASLDSRKAEIKAILEGAEQPQYAQRRDLPETGMEVGYAIWADTYDRPSDQTDPIEQLEEPVMRRFMDSLTDGPILDAACGTGRHTTYLVNTLGRTDVTGVDAVEAMLAKAREKCPNVEFHSAHLDKLPFDDASFAGVVCGLAYSHLKELGSTSNELARVLRPGGRLAVSAPHPFITGVLGWRAPLFDAEGNGSEMPEYYNLHEQYIDAFVAAGLMVKRCVEPRLSQAQARWNPAGRPTAEDDALEQALMGQPGIFLWELEKPA